VDWLCFDAVLKEKVEEFVDKIKNKDKNTENFPLDYEKEIDVKPEDFPLNSAKEIEEEEIEEDFWVDFSVPFENNWNTHIKPNWKITLYDENDKVIEQVWTENILNENWVIIWQKIVDYLPINEELWNVLPNSQRVFYQTWKWFPYETHDESWKVIIKYWSPSEYYSKKSKVSVTTIYPWQRIKTKLEFKKIKSITHLSYEKNNWELEEFNLTKDFFIKYKYEYIWYNPYFFIYLAIFLIVIWFFWFIILLIRKKKCPYCWKRIDKNLKICPYCWLTVEKF
jgi:hypothetical protein